jgi:mono/diheme cytochrome c family protein
MQSSLKLHLDHIIFLLLLLTVSPSLLSSQEDPVIQGEETYIEKCASCHGKDAKGKNAKDSDLGVNTPDLRMISKRNNGQFPVSRIYAIIDGREVVQKHGTRAMPTWGSLFLSDTIWEGCSQIDETIVRGRIMELILYLDSIQQ